VHAEAHQYRCPSRVRPMISDKGCRRTRRPGSERNLTNPRISLTASTTKRRSYDAQDFIARNHLRMGPVVRHDDRCRTDQLVAATNLSLTWPEPPHTLPPS
jgi:hypothetical protein